MLGAKTQEEYAKIAAVAAHEGDHLNGEHIEANAYGQSLDVYTQVVRNLGLKGDSNFALGMIAGMMLPENQRPNTGGVEYMGPMDFTDSVDYLFNTSKDPYLQTISLTKKSIDGDEQAQEKLTYVAKGTGFQLVMDLSDAIVVGGE